jgi:hypothetical protein
MPSFRGNIFTSIAQNSTLNGFAYLDSRSRCQIECTCRQQLAIRNAGFGSKLKVTAFNKLFDSRTVKCLIVPHYA